MSLLSYAPGPLDTDMQGTIRNELVNTALRDTFRKMKDEVRNMNTVSLNHKMPKSQKQFLRQSSKRLRIWSPLPTLQ